MKTIFEKSIGTARVILLMFFNSVLVVMLVSTSPVSALSSDQKRVIDSGVDYFDVEYANGLCGNPSISLIGNDNIERIYKYFIAKGLTPEQAAGVAGNAMVESGGDPTIVSKAGYHGIFQWDKSVRWPRLVAYAEQKGLDPNSLEAQLQFAFDEATGRGNIDGIKEMGSIDLAAWYWGRFFEGAVIGGSISKTPLTNVQALDKRIANANQIYSSYGINTAVVGTGSTTGSACTVGTGQDTQYVDGFTVYSQYDPAWKDKPYGTSTIGDSGCGPSAMAMIITNITMKPVTPVETANYASQIGMFDASVGSSWDIGRRLAQHWGLQYEPVSRDIAEISAALAQGKLIIAPGQGPKPFTTQGHFLVIRGVTADGKFKIGDSGHSDTSDQDWDPNFIVSNMRDGGIYAIYK